MAATYDFTIDRAEAKSFDVAVRHDGDAAPLTGYDAKLTAVDNTGTQALALSTAVGGGITIDEAAGTVTVVIKPSLTDATTWRSARYDLLVWHPGDDDADRFLVAGTITLRETVTRR